MLQLITENFSNCNDNNNQNNNFDHAGCSLFLIDQAIQSILQQQSFSFLTTDPISLTFSFPLSFQYFYVKHGFPCFPYIRTFLYYLQSPAR